MPEFFSLKSSIQGLYLLLSKVWWLKSGTQHIASAPKLELCILWFQKETFRFQ